MGKCKMQVYLFLCMLMWLFYAMITVYDTGTNAPKTT